MGHLEKDYKTGKNKYDPEDSEEEHIEILQDQEEVFDKCLISSVEFKKTCELRDEAMKRIDLYEKMKK